MVQSIARVGCTQQRETSKRRARTHRWSLAAIVQLIAAGASFISTLSTGPAARHGKIAGQQLSTARGGKRSSVHGIVQTHSVGLCSGWHGTSDGWEGNRVLSNCQLAARLSVARLPATAVETRNRTKPALLFDRPFQAFVPFRSCKCSIW